jgi:hypothetical protein
MVPGSVTEQISYFMGYIHLVDDTARAREIYDGEYALLRPDEFAPERPGSSLAHDIVELDGAPTRAALFDSVSDTLPEIARLDAATFGQPITSAVPFTLPDILTPKGAAGIAGDIVAAKAPVIRLLPPGDFEIKITYGSAGSIQARVEQFNWLVDNDQVGPISHAQIAQLHPVNVPQAMDSMFDAVKAKLGVTTAPPESGDTQAFVDAIKAHHDSIKAGTGPAIGSDAEEGALIPVEANVVYVDGVAQPAGTPHDAPELPIPPELDRVTNNDKAGLSVEAGTNVSFNAAAILDTNEANKAMIVLGDVFRTNAIIQANVYQDNDHVEVAGAETVRDLVTGENLATNIAEFIVNDPAFAILGQLFLSLRYHVDMVEGDLFDVSVLTQRNFLRDNDVTVQSHFESYYELRTGENHQFNLASLMTSGDYDLIIIGGNYHAANWIFQTNVLLDDDFLQIASGRPDAASQTINSGGNTLQNDATIETIGGQGFQPLTDDVLQLVQGLEGGYLDPMIGFQIPGGLDGEVNVLFITGDYYDLNVISQVNVIADVDAAMQILGVGNHEEADATQTSLTGGNTLLNLATIVDMGTITDYQFAGGDVYDDAILIQTNIISGEDETDLVEIRDTDTLVSEVIAFTDDADATDTDQPIAPTGIGSGADQGMGDIMH